MKINVTLNFNGLEAFNKFYSQVFLGCGQPACEGLIASAEVANEDETETAKTQAAETEEPVAAAEHSDKDLKILLSEKLKAGKKKEVKALFEKYGVSCLTDLIAKEQNNLDAVYAEAEVI